VTSAHAWLLQTLPHHAEEDRERASTWALTNDRNAARSLAEHPELVAAKGKAQAAQEPLLAVETAEVVVKPTGQPKPAEKPAISREKASASEDLRRVLAYRRKRAQYDRRKAVAASG
jgi:hypothetical protein